MRQLPRNSIGIGESGGMVAVFMTGYGSRPLKFLEPPRSLAEQWDQGVGVEGDPQMNCFPSVCEQRALAWGNGIDPLTSAGNIKRYNHSVFTLLLALKGEKEDIVFSLPFTVWLASSSNHGLSYFIVPEI